jgi:hypothetical protein
MPNLRPSHLLPALLVLLTGCSPHRTAKPGSPDLAQPLSQLADQGQLESLQLLADLEVLRAQGLFADSTVDRWVAEPAEAFLETPRSGGVTRGPKGRALTSLLARSDWSDGDRATLRRLAAQDLATAGLWADSVASSRPR